MLLPPLCMLRVTVRVRDPTLGYCPSLLDGADTGRDSQFSYQRRKHVLHFKYQRLANEPLFQCPRQQKI